MAISRNKPCPCGSGLKYKKCCMKKQRADIQTELGIRAAELRQKSVDQQRRYGNVKPTISAEHQEYRFVAVGDQLLYNKNLHSFTDFLHDFLIRSFGSGWGKKEQLKPLRERHDVMKWHAHYCDVKKALEQSANGMFEIPRDTTISAFFQLAYDLYVIQHHQILQKKFLKRLRQISLFKGARYELFVAATFIRAGFDIEHEDEFDASRKHCEFHAKHKLTSLVLAVEAKAKHRQLSETGPAQTRVVGLLKNAAGKKGEHPFVVFVELDLPTDPDPQAPKWIPDVQSDVQETIEQLGGNPFDLIVFTNMPTQYGEPGKPDPLKPMYVYWPEDTSIPMDIINSIGKACEQHGNIPTGFPTE